jgi:hypothetical protein
MARMRWPAPWAPRFRPAGGLRRPRRGRWPGRPDAWRRRLRREGGIVEDQCGRLALIVAGETQDPLAVRGRSERLAAQRHVTAAAAVRDHPTGWAAHRRRRGLHEHAEQPDLLVAFHSEDVEPVQADEQVAPSAVGRIVMAAREAARRRRGQRRGLPVRALGRSRSWRPRRLSPRHHTPTGAAHPHRNSEEPDCLHATTSCASRKCDVRLVQPIVASH